MTILKKYIFKRTKFSIAPFAVFILIFLKLLIISQNEIYLSSGDNLTYVFYADHHYWGTPFLPDRPPVTSLWMAFAHETGIRFRLLQEILYIVALCTAMFALNKAHILNLVNITFFSLTLFSPIGNYHLDFAMADGLYMTQQIFLVSFLFLILIENKFQRILFWSLLAGITAALMIHTRMELEYIILILCLFIIIFIKKNDHLRSKYIAKIFLLIIAIFSPIAISSAAIIMKNVEVYGYNGLANILSAGESAIMKQLMRIDGGHDGRYLPITSKARELAFQVSPKLNKWRSEIEDPVVIKYSEDYTGVANSLDTQRYLPLLKRIGQYSSYSGLYGSLDIKKNVLEITQSRETELNSIADELQKALDQGRIPARIAPLLLIDPVIQNWLPFIPESILKLSKLLFTSPAPWIDMQGYGLMKTESDRHTKVLNRDSSLLSKGPMTGELTIDSSKKVISVDLFVNALIYPMFVKFDEVPSQRISTAVLKKKSPEKYNFEFEVLNERWVPVTLALHVNFSDGSVTKINNLVTDTVVPLAADSSQGIVSYRISKFSPVISKNQELSYKAQNFVVKFFPSVLLIASFLVVSTLFIKYKTCFENLRNQRDLMLILSLCVLIFLIRALLLILVDVAAWHTDIRYVAPMFPVYIMLLALLSGLVFSSNSKSDTF